MARSNRIPYLAAALFGAALGASGCGIGEESFLFLFHGSEGKPVTDAGHNRAPFFTSVLAAPATTDVGGKIELFAAAYDPDGDPLSFQWSAAGGKIAKATAAKTTYTCRVAGTHEVAITVSDSHGLDDTMTFDIVCV